MLASKGYAAQNAETPLAPWSFERRDLGPNDIQIEIKFCGICHSDIHQARNEWGNSLYPMVPGHEIVGVVSAVGSNVKKFKVGDLAGVGCMVDSCHECNSCKAGEEQYCDRGATVFTYNGKDQNGNLTFGGYSNNIVVTESFALSISPKLQLAAVAPLLCAGITTYSPLRHWGAGPGKKVGIVGLGGLGHMGLKFSRAFGAHTTLFTTSPSKVEDARKLGADEVVISKDPSQMAQVSGSFDFILDCVSAEHDINSYLNLLRRDGTLCLVGVPEKPFAIHAFSVIAGRKSLSGSMIGGIRETQEMLDFCAEHNIVCDIEMTTYDKVNEAFERVVNGDVKYRFVLDAASL
ncbi:MAG: NAD(P)-dependent alcohol dehydrogenase [Acidobacteria bacterium]|nr:NAD(P)-dependent alcohol dehydrogenase [Acidobacteriota bacterium]